MPVALENPCDAAPNWPLAPKPVKSPLAAMKWATGTQKDRFGCTRDAGMKFHAAIDLEAAEGTLCFAVADAKVEEVGYGKDVGKYVSISYKEGRQTIGVAYCHLSKARVKKVDIVKAGTIIGETGTTGNASGGVPHLHLEIQNQVWVAYEFADDRSKHAMNSNSYME